MSTTVFSYAYKSQSTPKSTKYEQLSFTLLYRHIILSPSLFLRKMPQRVLFFPQPTPEVRLDPHPWYIEGSLKGGYCIPPWASSPHPPPPTPLWWGPKKIPDVSLPRTSVCLHVAALKVQKKFGRVGVAFIVHMYMYRGWRGSYKKKSCAPQPGPFER